MVNVDEGTVHVMIINIITGVYLLDLLREPTIHPTLSNVQIQIRSAGRWPLAHSLHHDALNSTCLINHSGEYTNRSL